MKVGKYEVSLITDSKILEEVTIDGKTYVCSEPGKEYHVNVAVYRDRITGKFPSKYLRFGLYVDGIDVQYWKRLDLSQETELPTDRNVPVCVKFWGFKQNVSDLKSFVFTEPTLSEQSIVANSALQQKMGVIRLVIFEAKVTNGSFDNQLPAKTIAINNSVSMGNVKILNQASMVTSTGRSISNERETFAPLQRWENLSNQPLATIDVNYHSRSIINLLSRLVGEKSTTKDSRKRALDLSQDTDNSRNVAKVSRIENDPQQSAINTSSEALQNTFVGEEEEEDGNDVVVVTKKRVAPMLDLSDDTAPVWSSVEM